MLILRDPSRSIQPATSRAGSRVSTASDGSPPKCTEFETLTFGLGAPASDTPPSVAPPSAATASASLVSQRSRHPVAASPAPVIVMTADKQPEAHFTVFILEAPRVVTAA